MLKGKADGGPLNGAGLIGPEDWDGLIRMPGQAVNAARPQYYPGNYCWNPDTRTWIWYPRYRERKLPRYR